MRFIVLAELLVRQVADPDDTNNNLRFGGGSFDQQGSATPVRDSSSEMS
jgi:hypothetical protein